MIKVKIERVFPLGRPPEYLPERRGGKRPHRTTLYRWATAGVRANDGAVVQLETIRVGGTLCTSAEALQRFFERLTESRAQAEPRGSASGPSLEH
jgi:hypothetical protein